MNPLAPYMLWIKLAAGIIVAGVAFFGGYYVRGVYDGTEVARAQLATQVCVAQHESGRANADDKVIGALHEAQAGLVSAMDQLAAQARDRAASDQKFLKELSNAPTSSVCGGSAAERAYRDSVRGNAAPATP